MTLTTTNSISIYKGDSLDLPVTITDQNGDAYDLTGYVMKMTIKKNKQDTADAIDTKTATIATPSSGSGTFAFTSSDNDIDNGIYYYDVEIENASTGDVKTVISDRFTVTQDLTA